jgi:hypothetical protein
MTRPAFGFDPPPFTYAPDLRWVLARAFGPVAGWQGGVDSGAAAAELAEKLDLAARIGLRVPHAMLVAEVGEAGAERCRTATRRAAAMALRQAELARRVAEVASGLGVPTVLLKGAALFLGGHAAPGSRAVADLDVLAARGSADRLQAALEAGGFVPGGTAYEHHLAPLVDPAGGVVEVHHLLWGVFLTGRRSAGLEELAAAGLLRPAPEFDPAHQRVALPVPAVLAAHAVLHGLVQHGLTPSAYPALRVLADLLDLGLADAAAISVAMVPLVRGYVSPAELEALASLCRALASGPIELLVGSRSMTTQRRILDHLVAGQLDRDYPRSLKRRLLERPFSDRPAAAARRAALAHALFPPASELDGLYGGPSGRFVRLVRRLRRPVDVALRLFRSELSALALRWRPRANR